MPDEHDLHHLRRCVDLALIARDAGDQPFGSILVSGDGIVLFEERNRARSQDALQHPEFAIARWAVRHLSPDERRAATVYTSGEHCPMCAAAHGLAGLGRIVFATSSAQLAQWQAECSALPPRVASMPIKAILPHAVVEGPVGAFHDAIRALHAGATDPRGHQA